jgi:hypothetical protein
MDQIQGFWASCAVLVNSGREVGGGDLVLQDSRAALETLLAVERRLQDQAKTAVASVADWCRLANACVQGMQVLELADRGESMDEMKGKLEMFHMLRKLHRRVATAASISLPDMSSTLVTGMPVGSSLSSLPSGETRTEHMLLMMAASNLVHTELLLEDCNGTLDGLLANTRMGVMRVSMVQTGQCMRALAEEIRDAARLYEASVELLGGVGEGGDAGGLVVDSGVAEGVVHHDARGALTRLVDLHRMVDALL